MTASIYQGSRTIGGDHGLGKGSGHARLTASPRGSFPPRAAGNTLPSPRIGLANNEDGPWQKQRKNGRPRSQSTATPSTSKTTSLSQTTPNGSPDPSSTRPKPPPA